MAAAKVQSSRIFFKFSEQYPHVSTKVAYNASADIKILFNDIGLHTAKTSITALLFYLRFNSFQPQNPIRLKSYFIK